MIISQRNLDLKSRKTTPKSILYKSKILLNALMVVVNLIEYILYPSMFIPFLNPSYKIHKDLINSFYTVY